MIVADGVEATEAWARGLVANMARPPQGGDTDLIKAVAAGAGDVTLVNTYYLARMLESTDAEEKKAAEAVAVFFPNQTGKGSEGRGAHVNISGAGIAAHAPNRAEAVKLLEFLVGSEAQNAFATAAYEYPIVESVPASATIAGFGTFHGDTTNIALLGKNNPEAVRLMDRAGWR